MPTVSDSRNAIQDVLRTIWLEETGGASSPFSACQNILRHAVNHHNTEHDKCPAQVPPEKEKREELHLQHAIG